jgi:hypothetical protein
VGELTELLKASGIAALNANGPAQPSEAVLDLFASSVKDGPSVLRLKVLEIGTSLDDAGFRRISAALRKMVARCADFGNRAYRPASTEDTGNPAHSVPGHRKAS